MSNAPEKQMGGCDDMDWIVRIKGLRKNFHLHTQGSVEIPVLEDFDMEVFPGENVTLVGRSGAGKSTLLKLVYGNYRIEQGTVHVRHGDDVVEMGSALPGEIIDVRKRTMGYVSQFLRVIPRVPALEVVMEPMRERKIPRPEAEARARELLTRLRIPERLWHLSPTTFSGGEQQRINIARGFAVHYPVMLLDEPTASLDPLNTAVVCEFIEEAREKGTAFIGIFHDENVRKTFATRTIEMKSAA